MSGGSATTRFRVLAVLVAALHVSAAAAQTANSGPTDPSTARLPGTPPDVTRTPSSVGSPRGGSKVPAPKIVTESDKEFQADQKRMQRDMNICKGC